MFLALAMIFLALGIYSLRQNNLGALKLRDNVSRVDEQNGDVEAALKELREYTYAHMNTNLATGTSTQQPIQLKFRYERLVAAEKQRVSAASAQLTADAQAACEAAHPTGALTIRAQCAQTYISSRAVVEQPIPEDLYKFSFAAPRWSPDFAGWSLVFAGLFFLGFVIRFGLERWMRYELKHHE